MGANKQVTASQTVGGSTYGKDTTVASGALGSGILDVCTEAPLLMYVP